MTTRASVEGIAAARSKGVLHMGFVGTSMMPVLEEDDVLEVVPYGARPIRPGDVVVFMNAADGGAVVHRVRSVSRAGIRTRGDNCSVDDRTLVQPENVVGRVMAAQRGVHRRRIAGGKAGLVAAGLCRLRRHVAQSLRPLVPAGYSQLVAAGVRLPAAVKPRFVSFTSPAGEHWRLMMGRHVVATYRPGTSAWRVRLPYRLFLDPASLSVPGSPCAGRRAR